MPNELKFCLPDLGEGLTEGEVLQVAGGRSARPSRLTSHWSRSRPRRLPSSFPRPTRAPSSHCMPQRETCCRWVHPW